MQKFNFSFRKTNRHPLTAVLSHGYFSFYLNFYRWINILCIFGMYKCRNTPRDKAAKRCVQHIFRTYAENFSPIFSKDFFLKLLPKNLAWYLKTEPNFVDNFCAEITFSEKSVVKWKPETKLCVKIYFAWQSELYR